MKLSQLVQGFEIAAVRGDDPEVTSFTTDSREAAPGGLFAAAKGEANDGHRFIPQAVASGVSALIVQEGCDVPNGPAVVWLRDTRRAIGPLALRFHGCPDRSLWIAGVTGTNGKTSTTYLAESILAAAGHRVGVIGTVNYRFAGEEYPADNTTPGPLELARLLRKMVDARVTHLVMEVSSHALEQGRVLGLNFDSALFTNLTRDHMDYHSTMEDYAQAKRRLFVPGLLQSAKRARTAIVNADDEASAVMLEGYRGDVIDFSLNPASRADLRASNLRLSIEGSAFDVTFRGATLPCQTPLIGAHNAANVLQALALGLASGIGLADCIQGVSRCRRIPGRLERVDDPRGIGVFVDYSHTPDALEKALAILRHLTPARVITVFGCGGDRDRGKRPLMGKVAAERSDLVVVTSDNPRTEDPFSILAQIEPGVRDGGLAPLAEGNPRGYEVIENRREAIERALSLAEPKDVVLIAGKGHEDYQIYGRTKNHFDDRKEAEAAIRRLLPREVPA